jgi:hypothetical protein
MEPDIKQKISDLIVGGVNTEAQAVYLMVQIRKLLESGPKGKYPHLKFNCDWALHAKLSGTTAQWVLERFDSANILLQDDRKLLDLPDGLQSEIKQISKMGLFKGELDSFLNEHSLPKIETNQEGWPKFLFFYAKVVEDCPLEIRPANSVSSIQKITISVEKAQKLLEDQQFYKISRNITERNGAIGEISTFNSFSVADS